MRGADVVVAGGGTAGAVVAARLVAAGASVTLVEAGPDHGAFTDGGWPAELTDAATIPTSHDWGYRSSDGRLAFERARVIGGCSAHNGCTAIWGHRADYDGWDLPGWSADELLPRFEDASRRLRVRRSVDDELTPFHAAFIGAGEAIGLPREDRLESLDVRPSVCAEPSNSPGGVRWNTAFAYLDPCGGLPGSRIVADTLVDRVLVHRDRRRGVRAIGPDGPFEIAADTVVLAGGTYGSPAILLRSGIGPGVRPRACSASTRWSNCPGSAATSTTIRRSSCSWCPPRRTGARRRPSRRRAARSPTSRGSRARAPPARRTA